jgi:hypothetical protein
MPQFLAAASREIPTFAGAKYTDNNLEEGTKCLAVENGTLSFFLGCDHVRMYTGDIAKKTTAFNSTLIYRQYRVLVIGLDVNIARTKYMFKSHHNNEQK